jgi:hypothetical protein
MDKQKAEAYIQNKIREFNAHYADNPHPTELAVVAVLTYDFGWYFKFTVLGGILIGGPEHGVLIHKLGYAYEIHYAGTSWDMGFGYCMDQTENKLLLEPNGNPLYTQLDTSSNMLGYKKLLKIDQLDSNHSDNKTHTIYLERFLILNWILHFLTIKL